jgi:MFS family permease
VLLIGPLANGKPGGEVGGGGRRARRNPSILASIVGVLVAFGAFGVLAIVATAVGLAIGGMPLDLAPGDWQGLATLIALGAATVSLLAYLFGGYVAARLGGRDGLQHGLGVFALAVVVIGVLGLLAVGMEGPASVGAGVREPAVVSAPGEGIRFGEVAVKAAVWSLIAMLAGSAAGGVLGGRANRRRAEAARGALGARAGRARDGRSPLSGE